MKSQVQRAIIEPLLYARDSNKCFASIISFNHRGNPTMESIHCMSKKRQLNEPKKISHSHIPSISRSYAANRDMSKDHVQLVHLGASRRTGQWLLFYSKHRCPWNTDVLILLSIWDNMFLHSTIKSSQYLLLPCVSKVWSSLNV